MQKTLTLQDLAAELAAWPDCIAAEVYEDDDRESIDVRLSPGMLFGLGSASQVDRILAFCSANGLERDDWAGTSEGAWFRLVRQ